MRSTSLFEPDVLLGAQWEAACRRGNSMSSEKRLMLAVLKSALESYQKHIFARDAEGSQLFKEAVMWIDSDDEDWFFSFRNICETLGIEPEHLRRRLMLWRRQAGEEQPGLARSARLARG